MTTVRDVMEMMETIAPAWMACDGDPNGLHLGDPSARIGKVWVALDATLEVIQRAKRAKAGMLVVHHPRFYHGLKTLDESTPSGRLAAEAVRAGIAIFCAHTNLDIAPNGVNDTLAELAGLVDPAVAVPLRPDPLLKLAVFVPESHLEAVREALGDAGAGGIGNYVECSFRAAGIGSFRGTDASKPYIGSAGVREEVEEWRLEVLLAASEKQAVLTALRAAHPYEEPAYDLYPLDDARRHGLGRVGALPKPTTLQAFAKRMKKATGSTGALLFGDPKRTVRRAAVWGGSGVPVGDLLATGAEVILCGELHHHDAEFLQQAGAAAVTLGHGPSEAVVLPRVAASLSEALPELTVEAIADGWPAWTAV